MKLIRTSILVVILTITPMLVISQDYPSSAEIFDAIKTEVDNGRSSSIVIGVIDNGKEDLWRVWSFIKSQINPLTTPHPHTPILVILSFWSLKSFFNNPLIFM